jgi:hydroxymethylbilane synthase
VSDAIRVGTRRSALARAQTDLIVRRLAVYHPRIETVTMPITTAGDRALGTGPPLDFTDALDAALENGIVDLAVHSAKDLPVRLRKDVRIVAVPPRADPRDCLVLARPGTLASMPSGAKIGSSSARRRAQMGRARPDVSIVELRGNVDSRIARVRSGELDGVVLAAAGVRRLGRSAEIDQVLDARRFLPCPGQGALAVTARAGDRRVARLVRAIEDLGSRCSLAAERAFTEAVNGDCTLPIAALSTVRGESISLRAELFSRDGARRWTGHAVGSLKESARVGQRLGRTALRAGVDAWNSPGGTG